MWLEREAIAQERFRKKREDEERKLKEKLEQEVMHVHVTLSKRLLISGSAGVILVMTILPKIEVMPRKTAWAIIMNADLRTSRADIT